MREYGIEGVWKKESMEESEYGREKVVEGEREREGGRRERERER